MRRRNPTVALGFALEGLALRLYWEGDNAMIDGTSKLHLIREIREFV